MIRRALDFAFTRHPSRINSWCVVTGLLVLAVGFGFVVAWWPR